MKQLKAEQKVEIEDRKDVTDGYRKQLDAVVRKLDALFDLRLSGEIDKEEFTKHKDKLLEEKRKFDDLINDTTNRVETWLERADQAFEFAKTANRRFELGTLDEKREILAALGSNLSLFNKTLSINLQKPLELIEEVAPDVQ